MAHPLEKTLRHGFDLIAEAVFASSDTIYRNDAEAMAFLKVSKSVFEQDYKTQCGLKQGNAMTYRKSDLLRRREQCRREQ